MPSLTLNGPAVLMMGTLLIGCGAEAADHATGEHIRSVEPFTETLVNPCNGEAIVFSGQAVLHVTQVDDRHLEFFTSAEGSGIGAGIFRRQACAETKSGARAAAERSGSPDPAA